MPVCVCLCLYALFVVVTNINLKKITEEIPYLVLCIFIISRCCLIFYMKFKQIVCVGTSKNSNTFLSTDGMSCWCSLIHLESALNVMEFTYNFDIIKHMQHVTILETCLQGYTKHFDTLMK